MNTTLTSILASLVFLFAIGTAGAAEPQEVAIQATQPPQDTRTVEVQTPTETAPTEFAALQDIAAEALKGEEMDEVRGTWRWYHLTYWYFPYDFYK